MSTRYEKLKKVENQINELCLLRRLKIEAEHRKRIKCIKTLRLYITSHTDSNSQFIRVDSRVINDFKNSEMMRLSDLVEKAYVVSGGNINETDIKTNDSKMEEETNNKEVVNKDLPIITNGQDENIMQGPIISNDDTNNKDVVNDDTNNKEVVNDDINNKEVVNDDINNKEVVNDDINNKEVVNDDINNKEVVNDDTKNKEFVNDEAIIITNDTPEGILPVLNDTTKNNNDNINAKDIARKVFHPTISNDDTPTIYEWVSHDDNVDSFELRLPSSSLSSVLVLVLKNKREIYKLSPPLSSLLSLATSSKPNLLGSLYTYIIKNSLLDKDSADYLVKCDEGLKRVFKKESFLFTDLPELVEDHLYPLDNIIINIEDSIVDIPIIVDDLFQHPKVHHKDVYTLERKIDTINEIKSNLERRKEILEEFSTNPINFINKWICLELEEFSNKTSVFKDDNVQEIMYDLLKQVI